MDNITLTLFNSHKEGQSSRSRTQQLLDVVTRDRRKDISRFLKDHGYSISVMQEKQENGVKLKKRRVSFKEHTFSVKMADNRDETSFTKLGERDCTDEALTPILYTA